VKANRSRPSDLDVVLQYYDASIRHGDREVGRILNALEALELSGRTVVLITSDHGEEFFEHGNCDHVRFLYREVVNVPLILRVPGHPSRGKRVGDVVPASISVGRTLLELVGIDASDFPGASLMPLLRGEASPFESVYSETDSIAGALGSRGATIARTTSRHKLIAYIDEKKDEGYDVATDVGEQHVLPDGDPVYQQRSDLDAWKESVVPIEPPARKSARKGRPAEELPSEIQKQLESLGYLEQE
jgi:arylsulfatase A-like enzyme